MNENVRIAIAVPYYNLVPVPFHISIIKLITQMKEWGMEIHIFSVDRTNCVMARNGLMEMFMKKHDEKSFNWIFHIDSDTVFRPDHFLRLLRDAVMYHLDILSGLYMQRGNIDGEQKPVIMRKVNGRYAYIKTNLTEAITPVDVVGFGFMICKPDVYIKLMEKYGRFVFDYKKSDDEILSEDMVWCERAKDAGYGINVDKDVVVGHYGVI